MKSSLKWAWLCVALSALPPAEAQTLTFDDLPAPPAFGAPVTNGYGGLQWNNVNYLDGTDFLPSGYKNGVVSGKNVAFDAGVTPASFISSVSLNLNSAYLTAAWNDGLQLEVQGYAGVKLIYDTFYTLNATTPILAQLNYLGVTEVDFISSGGINHGYDGSGTEFVMDDVSITAVPEPCFLELFVLGFAFLGLGFRTTKSAGPQS